MLLVYGSYSTKNTEKLVEMLDFPSVDIEELDTMSMEPIKENFVIVVPSYEHHPHYDLFADILDLDEDLGFCKGIVGTGNRNFAELYQVSAKLLAKDYDLPIIYGLEFFGTDVEREELTDILNMIDKK